MILLIYRDEVYDKNTTKKGIAEIDLAKHRNGEIGTFLLTFQGPYYALRQLTHRMRTPRVCCVELRACGVDRSEACLSDTW